MRNAQQPDVVDRGISELGVFQRDAVQRADQDKPWPRRVMQGFRSLLPQLVGEIAARLVNWASTPRQPHPMRRGACCVDYIDQEAAGPERPSMCTGTPETRHLTTSQ
ncbi:hypothetical protein [Mesorhizobium sp. 1B3]|uniref:hypothetical protein n=1 Tax=Mesorhizobium sp. 1B3 TaxID=3243599 RepID=UPI003D95A8D5